MASFSRRHLRRSRPYARRWINKENKDAYMVDSQIPKGSGNCKAHRAKIFPHNSFLLPFSCVEPQNRERSWVSTLKSHRGQRSKMAYLGCLNNHHVQLQSRIGLNLKISWPNDQCLLTCWREAMKKLRKAQCWQDRALSTTEVESFAAVTVFHS